MVNNVSSVPEAIRIASKAYLSGVYEEGSLLPSENELCSSRHVTRPTVRHALDSLVSDGLILKKQGKGSIVRKPPQNIGILSIAGTASAVGVRYLKTDILQKPEIRRWPENLHLNFRLLKRSRDAFIWKALRYVDDKPVFYDINHLPNINLPRFTSRSFENKSSVRNIA
jgi:DNA-binding GntR family transcriptional regulator